MVVLGAIFQSGCCEWNPFRDCPRDSPESDGTTIILSASPSNLPAGGGASNITAMVLDQNSIPLDGVAVLFSTNAGTLESEGVAQTTNGDGIARDVLRTIESAQVRAQSGDASNTVTVIVEGAGLVGSVILSCAPTSGSAPLRTTCTVTVIGTPGNPLASQIVSTIIVPGASRDPDETMLLETDINGTVTFDVLNITVDGSSIAAAAGGVASVTVIISIN